jgi:hypothetical protein
MGYPYDDNDNDYLYGLTEKQIRDRMNYAMRGDDETTDDDDDIYKGWSGLDDDDDERHDDDDSAY